jgi:histidine decarboxylase
MKSFCLKAVAALVTLLYATSAYALSKQDQRRLDEFARRALEKSRIVAGYPVNQNTSLDGFYRWYYKTGLYKASLNNVGNPRATSPYSLNTHQFENEVIDYFAPLYGFKQGDYWGFVTFSGTDGNQHGIYFGRKHLSAMSSAQPILYVSEEAHYSIPKLADVQNLEMRLIKTKDMGQMDLDDFEKQLDPNRPALIVVAMGSTFKGAIDSQEGIRKVLQAKLKAPSHIHLDAALFGGFLAYADNDLSRLVSQQVQKFDSIAVSGHKFFGFDEPMGLFITTKETFENINPMHVNYLKDAVPTITCSRSGISPLKFWWKIHSTSVTSFKDKANTILKNADYLSQKLREAGVRVWKNPISNTVFFERPDQSLLEKYDLAPEESASFGKLAHIVVMPHISKPLMDAFVKEMKGWKARSLTQN